MHRRLGLAAIACAAVVGLSTLFTKQHYVLDVISGIVLAVIAYALFLRSFPRDRIADLERRTAPAIGGVLAAGIAVWVAIAWLFYLAGVGPR